VLEQVRQYDRRKETKSMGSCWRPSRLCKAGCQIHFASLAGQGSSVLVAARLRVVRVYKLDSHLLLKGQSYPFMQRQLSLGYIEDGKYERADFCGVASQQRLKRVTGWRSDGNANEEALHQSRGWAASFCKVDMTVIIILHYCFEPLPSL
jgi:hypothetical protein